ncbi:Alpha/Beta hydrolase protein [Exophiala viscosa]|uniref:Alpha/Beta hydrolase protein n=1 Tax=Exophiala viscosa TaxID=2486360 RepID=UPI002190D864|nr:Alpha/Beta hydrolase protein [Exophiala viscosa]
MTFDGFNTLPTNAAEAITPWKVSIPQQDLDRLATLLQVSELAPPTFENSLPGHDRRLGIRRDWLSAAKHHWETEFDWRKHEEHINSLPQFKATIRDSLGRFDIHFVALFSKRENAIPIMFLHGWPGSFLEFLPILESLRSQYTAETLPYHLIVPSLPGYTFSSPPPLDHDFRADDAARIFDSLMSLLGFKSYMVQGGDVGGRVGRIIASNYPNCKAIHLNTCPMPEPEHQEIRSPIDAAEQQALDRHNFFLHNGTGYAQEHATRPSTIGFVLSSNPLALLSWIGEKFMDWTDDDPPLDVILESVTLYWVTRCASTSLWSYRQFYGPNADSHGSKKWYLDIPFGFSWFPREINPLPRPWIETTGNLVFFRRHEKGGHFAAMERPRELWADVEEYLQCVKGAFDTQ